MFTVIPYKKKLNLIEDRQFIDISLSFCKKINEITLEEITPKFHCRDFIGDVLLYEETKQPFKIYGFTSNHIKDKIDRDKIRFLITFNKNIEINIHKNIRILHRIEKQLKRKKTIISPTNNQLIFLIEGDSWWLKSNIHISFYTYLLKCITHKLENIDFWQLELKGNEKEYFNRIKDNWNFFLNWIRYFKPFNGVSGFEKSSSIANHHHYSGFVSLISSGWKPKDNVYNNLFTKELQLQKQGSSNEMSSL